MDASKPNDVSDIAFAVYKLSQRFSGEVATEWSNVQQRLETIRKGLQPKAEFIAIANWLGRCVAIHRLDQTPLPKYNDLEDSRTPDLLAIVSRNEKLIPVLIEVKSTAEKQVLKWSEKYLTSLRRYATTLGFPLLVAWKWRNQWLLVEDRHFTKAVLGFHLPA